MAARLKSPKPQQTVTTEEYKAMVRAGWSEAEFQQNLIDLAHSHGWTVAAFRKVRVQRKNGSVYWETPVQADGKGWLDLALTRTGFLVFAEAKVGKNKLTPEQKKWKQHLEWVAQFSNGRVRVFEWRPSDWEKIKLILAR